MNKIISKNVEEGLVRQRLSRNNVNTSILDSSIFNNETVSECLDKKFCPHNPMKVIELGILNKLFVVIDGCKLSYNNVNKHDLVTTTMLYHAIKIFDFESIVKIDYASLINSLDNFNSCTDEIREANSCHVLCITNIDNSVNKSNKGIAANGLQEILANRFEDPKQLTILSFNGYLSSKNPITGFGSRLQAISNLEKYEINRNYARVRLTI